MDYLWASPLNLSPWLFNFATISVEDTALSVAIIVIIMSVFTKYELGGAPSWPFIL